MSESNNIEKGRIENLKGLSFLVNDYQRGYKWTAREVLDLLEDINSFDPEKQAFYCLQPLVVTCNLKPEDRSLFPLSADNVFEVIDGQQRLTTIHLILKEIDQGIFSIKYKTRSSSTKFLEGIKQTLSNFFIEKKEPEYEFDESQGLKEFEKEINIKWKDYLEKNGNVSGVNNIEGFHFFTAYLTSKYWFAQKEKNEKEVFLENLKKRTSFIWYEDTSGTDAKEFFRNLNSGKIELTNAELIKALFINSLKDQNEEVQRLKQTTLAREWDQIEQQLQEEDFWCFISSEESFNFQTRIDLLFEIITGKQGGKNNKLSSYRVYAKRYENNKMDWQEVKHLFLQLKEWYQDREKYHLIGFIVDREIKTISEIITAGSSQEKSKFKTVLIDFIKKFFDKKKNGISIYHLRGLDYRIKSKAMETVLLLHNIETYQKSEVGFRFPFAKFKTQKWSLEHIHPQQPKDFKKVGELKGWVNDTSLSIDEIDLNQQQKDEAKEILEKLEVSLRKSDPESKISTEQAGLFQKIIDLIGELSEDHGIRNMALLDRGINSKLGNKTFKDKQKIIIGIDQQKWLSETEKSEKSFIPICTKNAFLKYYTEDIKQVDFWGIQDRIDYYNNIVSILGKYYNSKQ